MPENKYLAKLRDIREAATLIVAASDSLHKGRADYVCDGTDDEEEIKAAMDALPPEGGKVVLLDGTYYIHHTLYFSRGNMIIEGQGASTILRVSAPGASIFVTDLGRTYVKKASLTADAHLGDTVLTVDDTSGLSVGDKIVVQRNYVVDPHIIKSIDSPTQLTLEEPLNEDFYVGNEIGLQDWYENIEFLNMKFYLPSGIYDSGNHHVRMITVAGKYIRVANCIFVDDSGYGGNVWPMVFWGGGTWNVYLPSSHIIRENNILINCGCVGWGGQFHIDRNNVIIDSNGESFSGDVQHSIIEGNILIGGTRLSWSNIFDYNIVRGNIMINCGNSPINYPTGHHSQISNNVIINANGKGINIGNTSYMDIVNNHIYKCQQEGIYAAYGAVKHAKIIGNTVIDCGKAAADTYAGILVDHSGTLDCLVLNNLVRKGTGNTNKYGILIGAGATGTVVLYNDIRDSGTTANFYDAGTGTIYYELKQDLFIDVLAEDADYVHAAITPDGAEHTDTTNPDVPRNVMIRITNTDGVNPQTPDGGDIIVEGVDAKGNSISETLTVPNAEIAAGDHSDVYGSKAFATVTKVTYYSESNTNITVSVGISDKLGLSNLIYATGDVYKIKKNNADISVPTVDVTNGTVDCATITGGDNFTIYYRSNLNIVE